MDLAFVNGPIQNGYFTFRTNPGKGVGVLIAEALNHLLGNPSARHLWNCATLAGDIRYRESGSALARMEFEFAGIRRKYAASDWENGTFATLSDIDPEVQVIAHKLIDQQLSAGALRISPQTVWVCAGCAHMVGTVRPQICASCEGTAFHVERRRQLISDRPKSGSVLGADLLYGTTTTKHLRAVAANVPDHLLLSRTRSHGISLDPFGLGGLVLDPRSLVHVTALTEAERLGAERAVMMATPGAIANIAAYGHPFRAYNGISLLYGRHCKTPDGATGLSGVDPDDRRRVLFRRWFLPLVTVGRATDIGDDQILPLFTYFRRVLLHPGTGKGPGVEASILAGNSTWPMDRNTMGQALRRVW